MSSVKQEWFRGGISEEDAFRAFRRFSPNVLWIRDADTLEFEFLSPAFEEVYGTPREEVTRGDTLEAWLALIDEEDRDNARRSILEVRAGRRVTYDFRLQTAVRRPRWVRDTSFPMFDDEGRVRHLAGIGRDVTEQRQADQRNRVLVAELHHRTRNLLAVVQALSRATLEQTETAAAFHEVFGKRLEVLGRAQGLISDRPNGERPVLDQLLAIELSAVGALDRAGTVMLSGPDDVPLQPADVQTLALALHELATNAVKHGALSRSGGQLRIAWHVEGAPSSPVLHLEWQESGVAIDPDRSGTGRAGYGRELIEEALPYQLGAQTSYELTLDGVRCRISLPVPPDSPKE